jgi:hypothetical protein
MVTKLKKSEASAQGGCRASEKKKDEKPKILSNFFQMERTGFSRILEVKSINQMFEVIFPMTVPANYMLTDLRNFDMKDMMCFKAN